MISRTAFLVVSLFTSSTLAQENAFGEPIATLPFKMTAAGNIALPATLNGTESVNLMFHSASTEVHLTKDCVAQLETLEFKDTVESKTWGGTSETRVSTSNTIQLDSLDAQTVTIFEDLHSGTGTDGKFGWDRFGERIFEIDFEKQHIQLYDTIDAPESYERLEFRLDRGMILIPAGVAVFENAYVQHQFLVHTGFTGAVLFDNDFSKLHLENRLEIRNTRELKDSFGNVLEAREVRLPGFRIGRAHIKGLDAEYFDGKLGDRKLSILGMEVIQQFHWFFDTQNQVAYASRIGR